MQISHIVLDKHCTLWSSIYKLITNFQYWTSIQWELILESTSQTSHIILYANAVALFPGLPIALSSFWSLTVCQNKRRGLWPEEHVACVCSLSWTKSGNIFTSQTFRTPALGSTLQEKASRLLSVGDLPPSVYTHGINAPRPSLFISSYCKQSKTGWWKRPGNEATILWLTNVVTTDVVTVLNLHGNIILVQWGQWLQKRGPHLHDILRSICQV